jgi:hypothetical protein
MASYKQQRDEERVSRAALKMRVAGIVTAGVVVNLILTPPAFAMISPNHNETVLAVD